MRSPCFWFIVSFAVVAACNGGGGGETGTSLSSSPGTTSNPTTGATGEPTTGEPMTASTACSAPGNDEIDCSCPDC